MKDFVGFRFGNVHTKDLRLVVVTSSDRYEKNLLPNPKDYTVEIPGDCGQYYFGQTFDSREFNCNVAFDSVDENTWRKISQLFSTDKLQDLVFDELPYKTYKAKLKTKPEFKFICFTDRDTGERVYKGEGTLNFICYFPYAFCKNKYIVKAADYYSTTPPKTIIKTHTDKEHPYADNLIEPIDKHTKTFYNTENNMNTSWEGGYPTIEQVQAGELFFNNKNGVKCIINTRGYWDNVPEWAPSSKLLTTPTLDYDQELIYLPQYSKTNYINMDTGLNNDNALIGSRLLVYNPGDVPVDFHLKLDNNEKSFWTGRGNHFQIRRLNVERLTIPEAVDWTGLKPYNLNDEKEYKYGNKYFKLPSLELPGEGTNKGNRFKKFVAMDLKDKHPNHTYIVEPIPKEKLGDFIKMFYWQSSNYDETISYQEGEEIADEYERLYNLCILDEEKEELYWRTLKELLYNGYKNQQVFKDDKNYSVEDMFYDYIYNPPEYIQTNDELDYGLYDFNSSKFPYYYTEDYLEIKTDGIPETSENCTLYVDSSKQMLYSLNKSNNFYNYSSSKNIFNDNIIKGKWFKIPPGWSLIEIAPVCSEDDWGGKTWNEARSFKWGYGGDENCNKLNIQKLFDEIYYIAAEEYLRLCGKIDDKQTIDDILSAQDSNYTNVLNKEELKREWLDSQLRFRSWYLEKIQKYQDPRTLFIKDKFAYSIYKKKEQQAEYGFLKLLHQYWRINKNNIDYSIFNTSIFDDITREEYKIGVSNGIFYTEKISDRTGTNSKDIIIIDDYTKKPYKIGISNGVFYTKQLETTIDSPVSEIFIEDDSAQNVYLAGIENGNFYLFEELLYDTDGDINEWWWYACNYIWENFPPLYWGFADILNKAKIDYTPLFY